MPVERRSWSEEELLVVFRLYCRTPFGRLNQRNPEIMRIAELIGRTPSAVTMKACNFASLDPHEQARSIRGLSNVSRADRQLWQSFLENLTNIAQKAESVYATMTGIRIEDGLSDRERRDAKSGESQESDGQFVTGQVRFPEGATVGERWAKTRRVQSFFRAAVLTSYKGRCAITGLAIPELLNASHIIPWSVDERRRADPRNGLCLNAFHDRAFDRGLITFSEDLRLVVSPAVESTEECEIQDRLLVRLAGHRMRVPERFHPDLAALSYHREHIFID